MKKLLKIYIAIVLFLNIILLSKNIYAKYSYIVSMDAFSLTRDAVPLEYTLEKSVSDNIYTNEDITVKIIVNKAIDSVEGIEGFELDDTKTILTKTYTENIENDEVIKLEDKSGNFANITYSVNNIDKEAPKIVNSDGNLIEDGMTYNTSLVLDYTDNVGVAEIYADKYDSELTIFSQCDYYDAGFFKGLDIRGTEVYVDVTAHPKGTKNYEFYLNGNYVATTTKSEYTYTGLTKGTYYTMLVKAIDANGNVLDSKSQTVKTKTYDYITSQQNGDNFTATIYGIDNRMNAGYYTVWTNEIVNNKITTYPQINSDRSITFNLNANDLTGTKSSGYYYLHFQLVSESDPSLNEVAVINLYFTSSVYTKVDDDDVDPRNLVNNGMYELIAIDYAGNKTQRNITIKK